MGFMDVFSSDGTVEMKHTEYYQLMREAAKAELITNAVVADVPNCYTKAMITGEKPEIKAIPKYSCFHCESANVSFLEEPCSSCEKGSNYKAVQPQTEEEKENCNEHDE